uniref:Uncharacterized protein n=1 Tax=Lepeophtheirus salmonis TaxID=72036 RepID=A0A0K2UFP9_LEPSM
MSSWYSVFSSRKKYDTEILMCAYGGYHYIEQKNILEKLIEVMEKVRKCGTEKHSWPFQRAMKSGFARKFVFSLASNRWF